MKILYAEDEVSMSEAVVEILTHHNHSVDAAYDGYEALRMAQKSHYDLIILDIMMPKMDGMEVLKELRLDGCTCPILLLSAKNAVEDRIMGLDLGADGYLPKPFVMGELMARIRALLRRRESYTPDKMQCGNLCLDRKSSSLSVGDQRQILPKREYKLMEQLMANQGMVLTTEELLLKAWGYDTDVEMGAVWVYISYLRNRMRALDANVIIRAKRGVGYCLEPSRD